MEDIFSLVNPDIRRPFDMKEVLLRIVDDSKLAIFKPSYGKNLCTAWASIMGMILLLFLHRGAAKSTDRSLGYPVGIVANQIPVINPDEAMKGAQFIRLCNQQYVHSTIPYDFNLAVRNGTN